LRAADATLKPHQPRPLGSFSPQSPWLLVAVDLCSDFYSEPVLGAAEYKRIAKLLHERRIDREHYIDEFVGGLRMSMKEEGVKAEVYGRPKHIYSIWRKMQKKHLAFDELFDVRAVRIVAERLQERR
jgi:hypothetical protein